MLPFEFAPILPIACLCLALMAVPIAVALRRLSPSTQPWGLPAGWQARKAAQLAVIGMVSLLAVLVTGLVLEMATTEILRTTAAGGHSLAHPDAWLASGAALWALVSRWAWQLTLLLGPLCLAMDRITEVRWVRRWALGAALGMLTPVITWAWFMLMPMHAPTARLLTAALVWGIPLQIWVLSVLLKKSRSLWMGWRAQAGSETTRATPMPAAMAATLKVGSGRTTGGFQVKRCLLEPRPRKI